MDKKNNIPNLEEEIQTSFENIEDKVGILLRNKNLSEREIDALYSILGSNVKMLSANYSNQTTGIRGRRARDAFIRAIDATKPIFVYGIDIDHFKDFNTKYGHEFGDQVLYEVMNAVSHSLRHNEGDAFHVSGEEGEAISYAHFTGNNPEDLHLYSADEEIKHLSVEEKIALKIGDRMRRSVENTTLHFRRGNEREHEPINVTISVGISRFYKEHGEDYVDAKIRADSALYVAKNNGRNRVAIERTVCKPNNIEDVVNGKKLTQNSFNVETIGNEYYTDLKLKYKN